MRGNLQCRTAINWQVQAKMQGWKMQDKNCRDGKDRTDLALIRPYVGIIEEIIIFDVHSSNRSHF